MHLLLSDEGREALMYEIAPLVCRSESEQQQFYQAYKKYLNEDLKKDEQEKAIEQANIKIEEARKEIFKRWRKGLLTLAGLALFFPLLWGIWRELHPPKPKIHFNAAKNEVILGRELSLQNYSDTLHAKYRTFGKKEKIAFQWIVLDDQADTLYQNNPFHFQWKIPDTLSAEYIAIHLHGIHARNNTFLDKHTEQINLLCNTLTVGSISIAEGETHFYPDSSLTFSVEVNPEDHQHLSYQWDFGDGNKAMIATPQHSYDTSILYPVSVIIKDTSNIFGFCERTVQTNINIQPKGINPDSLIVLNTFELQKIEPISIFRLYYWVYIFLILLLGGAGLLWWKWHNRPDPNKEKENANLLALQKRFNAPDKSPYSIPFKKADGKINTVAVQYDIAASLRRRQEGLRKEIDIKATLDATVDQGGFPTIQYKHNTQPTHYLVLIDWQTADSHQARLFQYLAEMMQQQDVLFNVFFYQENFNRIWNKQFPRGIALNQLYQIHAHQRLLIFGDAHALVKQSTANHLTHFGWSKILRKWTNRLLITPIPIISWTYLEARLYCLFPIFAGDLNGVLQAVQFLEAGKTEENLPNTLAEWEIQLNKSHIEENINRRWHTLKHHEKYLKSHSEVFRWFKALVVYPNPTWNITIAIGKALGVPVTYDNLMLLARIPWLQQGDLPMDLWEEIWEDWSTEDERIARTAVKTELKIVQTQTANAFANQALEQDLAIQEFILQPQIQDNQEAIQHLKQADLLPEIHLEELDIAVERHTNFKKRGNNIGETLGYFLDSAQQTTKHLTRPFYTLYFWVALLSSLISILSILGTVFAPNNSPIMQEMVQKPSETARLNNLAVRVHQKDTSVSQAYLQSLNIIPLFIGNYTFSPAALLLERAVNLDSNLIKAQSNLLKVMHNEGVTHYDQMIVNDQYDLNLAMLPLNAAIQMELPINFDSIRHTAMHALANVYHLLEEENEVCDLLDTLRKVPDLSFFKEIPNLDSKAEYCQLEEVENEQDSLPLITESTQNIEFLIDYPDSCVNNKCEILAEWTANLSTLIEGFTWKSTLYIHVSLK